eukprot:TRINITY_DN2031_c0_g2_i8.p1 TRINITY_DN2031_c0_g2~~TRINITY_DN2031_c0_g2_i8.p1  ORF type:complete len:268 (-),score=43.95 TRINITY_DN2031_c0_g2_i8:112-915(-)
MLAGYAGHERTAARTDGETEGVGSRSAASKRVFCLAQLRVPSSPASGHFANAARLSCFCSSKGMQQRPPALATASGPSTTSTSLGSSPLSSMPSSPRALSGPRTGPPGSPQWLKPSALPRLHASPSSEALSSIPSTPRTPSATTVRSGGVRGAPPSRERLLEIVSRVREGYAAIVSPTRPILFSRVQLSETASNNSTSAGSLPRRNSEEFEEELKMALDSAAAMLPLLPAESDRLSLGSEVAELKKKFQTIFDDKMARRRQAQRRES